MTNSTDKSQLQSAIEFAQNVNPLPRCKHDNALRDGAGELLEPPCGCRFDKSAAAPAPERIYIRPRYANTLAQQVMDGGIFHYEGSPECVEYVRADLASPAQDGLTVEANLVSKTAILNLLADAQRETDCKTRAWRVLERVYQQIAAL